VKRVIPVLALACAADAFAQPAGVDRPAATAPIATIAAASPGDGRIPTPVSPGPRGHIKHVVVIFQENRTPDNLFQGLPGADIAASGLDSKGNTIPLQPIHLANDYDLGHHHYDFLDMYDGGKMDGADKILARCKAPAASCGPPDPSYMYVYPEDVAPYMQLAQTYTFGDRMFQSNQGPSFPAHQYIIAGTSTPTSGGQWDDWLASENPRDPPTGPTGCVDAPATQKVPLIDPNGVENNGIYPCYEHATLMDLLDQAGHSWSYYATSTSTIWTGPNAIAHIREGADWARIIIPETTVLTDIASGTLADVSWVTPNGLDSDHAMGNDGSGPSWVASIVNAIGNSAYWSDTAIFITWDDWGGWYDHVAPPVRSSYEAGFRVPLIVVSPYAKKAYVSHQTHLFGSILRFIEETYGLGSLHYEDAIADDLRDCFDFTQSLPAYRPVKAPHDAAYFLERARHQPPTDPDDD
jgi:phospholipase C